MQIELPNVCRLCGSESLYNRTTLGHGLEVSYCPSCGTDNLIGKVLYLEPNSTVPEKTIVGDAYTGFSAGQRSERYWEDYVSCATQRLSWQKKQAFYDRGFDDLTFLDIGCGGGHFLEAAKRLGFRRAVGTEVDSVAVAKARSKGLEAYVGEWPVANVASERFDFISLMHVLEHVPNPASFLTDCLNCLAPGGLLAVDVPDQGSFPSFFKMVLHAFGRRSREYGYVVPPWHLSGFRMRSFEWFTSTHGLDFVWNRRTSPLDRTVYPHTENYWTGRFRWNKRIYMLSKLIGQGGNLTLGMRALKCSTSE